jgi:transposase
LRATFSRVIVRIHGITATMRQTHAAGEKLFVDFAGDTLPVFDGLTGEVRAAKIFVAVLGASNYTFAQARFSEALPDWIGVNVDALTFLGGVPKALVCDNLKAGVTAANRYEPGVNRTYQDLAAHYGTTIMPARPRKPRDKAKVEAAVLIVQRWILARLRNRRFFSLAELNVAIRTLVDELNGRLMHKLAGISVSGLIGACRQRKRQPQLENRIALPPVTLHELARIETAGSACCTSPRSCS